MTLLVPSFTNIEVYIMQSYTILELEYIYKIVVYYY
jgi:hypothetical protein